MSWSEALAELPPAVDAGNPPGSLAQLRRELAPLPGRLSNTLRIVVLVLIAVTLSETFRIPETALSPYIILFLSKNERASTVRGAAIAGIAVILAIWVTILVFMLSLSEPALRLPLIALMTFIAMFLARTAPRLGPAFFAAGFIIAYGLTLGDEVLALSLQPGSVANTAEFSLPELAFLPPEEVLLHFLLWLTLAVAIPVALVIVGNLLTGSDPALLLRAALAERLEVAARFCEGVPGSAPALEDLAREGIGELLNLHAMSRPPRKRETDGILTVEVSRLSQMLLITIRLPATAMPANFLTEVGRSCAAAARAVRAGSIVAYSARLSLETVPSVAAKPIVTELLDRIDAIHAALATAPGPTPLNQTVKPPREPLLSQDAFTNPGHIRFALKVTLAVLTCYLIQSLTNWPGIHTCVITCFFVSLTTVGETVHKATLRITGCLIGGALGIGTIIFLMPYMTSIGDLLSVLAVITFLAAWIGNGSERIAYAGWQVALAFYLAVLQGYGPTLDMETARDRIIGILLGNIIVFAIFTTLWPVRVEVVVRAALAQAVEQLAVMMQPAAKTEPTVALALRAFGGAIGRARAVMVNDRYEALAWSQPSGGREIDAAVVLDVQALVVPVSIIADLRAGQDWTALPQERREAMQAHDKAIAEWLHGSRDWLQHGAGATVLISSLSAPPVLEATADPTLAAWTFWSGLLYRDIRDILLQIVPTAIAERATNQAGAAIDLQ